MRLRWGRLGLVALLFALAGASPARAGLLEELLKPEKPRDDPTYQNPVLTGDYPDPSVMRHAGGWWAAVTSDGWMPPYSILHSPDLVHWRVVGSVFRHRPRWAREKFWAPEIVRRGTRFLVYYAALHKKGRFCVGVGWSERPYGPYRDEGPVVCPPLGAIDPVPVLDESGRPNLVWKENGNAKGRPTSIIAAPLTRDGFALAGPWRELLRNDAAWEARIIEAPSMTRHAGRFYMLYSAGSCCGPRCSYTTGVARSERLYGRWEKHPGPILGDNDRFRCPGHGAAVDGPWGREYFVYHAYSRTEPLLVGRQLLIDRLDWDETGWPAVNEGEGPSLFAVSPLFRRQRERRPAVHDEFTGRLLHPAWQWPAQRPRLRLDRSRGGRLLIRRGRLAGIAGRQPSAPTYVAETTVGRRSEGSRPGLAVYAARDRAVGIELRGSRAVVWRSRRNRQLSVASMTLPRMGQVALRLEVVDSHRFTFRVFLGGRWRAVGPAHYRPPFQIAIPRVVLRVAGPKRSLAAFERFRLVASR